MTSVLQNCEEVCSYCTKDQLSCVPYRVSAPLPQPAGRTHRTRYDEELETKACLASGRCDELPSSWREWTLCPALISPCLALTLLCSALLSALQELLLSLRLSSAHQSASPSHFQPHFQLHSLPLPLAQHLPGSLLLSSCPPSLCRCPVFAGTHTRKLGVELGTASSQPRARWKAETAAALRPASLECTAQQKQERFCLKNTENSPR